MLIYLSKEEFLVLLNLRKNKNIVIRKFDRGNSTVTVDETNYVDKMEDLLNETRKFEKNSRKNDETLSSAVNQGKHAGNVFKKFLVSSSISEETRNPLKPVVTWPGLMYGLYKLHKNTSNCQSFGPILSAINTLTYKLATFLVPILNKILNI